MSGYYIVFCDNDGTLVPYETMGKVNKSGCCHHPELYKERGKLADPSDVAAYKQKVVDIQNGMRRLGPSFIVTAAGMSWINSIKGCYVNLFLPIESARDKYQRTSTDPTKWKYESFKEIYIRTVQANGGVPPRGIICIGDGSYEHKAAAKLGRDTGIRVYSHRVSAPDSISELLRAHDKILNFLARF